MSVAYVVDELFEAHRPPRAHPERPERLAHLRTRLEDTRLRTDGSRLALRNVADDELGRVHRAEYLSELERTMPGQSGWLDSDTYFSEQSWEAARAAAAAAVDVTQAVLDDRCTRGLALVRPPGHHAEADRAMGFCLFNNIAVAAASARAAGAAKVAVLDFDVHHGNGTQHMFESDPNVLFMSVHQHPYYPGTGRPTDVGHGEGVGMTVNVGLPAGCGDGDYDDVFAKVFEPAIARFAPDVILASAGYDAADVDPLAQMNVTTAGYRSIANRLCAIADRHADGRLVAVLEGGYDLDGLADGVVEMVESMLGRPAERSPQAAPSSAAQAAIEATMQAHPWLVEAR